MINPNSQLILNFELQDDYSESSKVRLSALESEREYFAAQKERNETFEVELPRPFHETALMDSKDWRRKTKERRVTDDLGARMWFNLPPDLRQTILHASVNNPLRVAIASHANGLDDIPWEWLNDGNNQSLAAMDSVRFMRLVPTLYASPPVTVELPIRVLIVLTNPKDERLLQSNVEIKAITQGLYNTPEYQVKIALEPRVEPLRREMEWEPHIIHYVGHAGISGNMGCLIIHSDQDGTRWLPAAEAARFIPSSVRLICLSTCVTVENYQIGGLNKFAHVPADVTLPTTIVNQYSITENTATNFWSRFYPALIRYDGNVVEAFHESRMAIKADETITCDWASFSLVVRDGVGHPLKLGKSARNIKNRFNAEIQAQLSARLANNLASRLSTLDPKYQAHWEISLAEETSRLESFEKEIDEEEKGAEV